MAKKTAGSAVIEEIVRRPYTVEVMYGESAGDGVLAQIAEWPGCMTAGDTRAEALTRLEDAMRDWAEARLATGAEVPVPMADYRGNLLVRIPKMLHRDVAARAQREGVSLNHWIATTIARAVDATDARAIPRRASKPVERARTLVPRRARTVTRPLRRAAKPR